MNSNIELYNAYDYLTIKVSKRFKLKLPKEVLYDYLLSAARLGLWKAVLRKDEAADFEKFAYVYIRGAIIDDLREQDWLPRRMRIKLNKQKKSNIIDNNITPVSIVSFEDLSFTELNNSLFEDSTVEETVNRKLILEKLESTILSFSERKQILINKYYFEEMMAKDIAVDLKVSAGRIPQILHQIKRDLKKSCEEMSI